MLFKDLVPAFDKVFISCRTDSGCLVARTLEEFESRLQDIVLKNQIQTVKANKNVYNLHLKTELTIFSNVCASFGFALIMT